MQNIKIEQEQHIIKVQQSKLYTTDTTRAADQVHTHKIFSVKTKIFHK